MDNFEDYMLLFRIELNSDRQASLGELSEMKRNWGAWIKGIALQARLVSSHQLGLAGNRISNVKKTESAYVIESGKSLSGNLVLKALNLEEATKTAENYPILDMGATVEIRSTLSVY